jgi:esterase/lipase
MKKNMEEKKRKLKIQDNGISIFGISLFLSKGGVISLKVAYAFVEYEHIKINYSIVILAKT